MHFAHRKNLAFMIQDLKWFYADKFHSGSIDKAKSKLETFNKKMRRSDLAYIYFFGGMSCTMTFMGVSFLFLKSEDGKEYHGVMVSSLEVIRLTFLVVFILISTGVAIQIFNKFKINYLYIFELDQHAKMNAD
jgi:hypothetical protein